jgi:hypothetical protein
MKRLLLSCALLVCAGLLHAQLEEDFSPHPSNWIKANGYSYRDVNGNEMLVSSGGNSPAVIGTPIVKKTASTVSVCLDVFGFDNNALTGFPCDAFVDLYFVKSSANNGVDLNDPDMVLGSVMDIAIPAAGGRICTSFTFPAGVPDEDFRMFVATHEATSCNLGNLRYAFDNFSISGLGAMCTDDCPPVALPDVFFIGNPAATEAKIILYGTNSAYPSPSTTPALAGYVADPAGIDDDPDDAFATLSWSMVTPPAVGTGAVTMNTGGSGTATVTRSSLSVTQVTFTYQLCDPGGLCDQATVTVNFIAGGALPVSLVDFNGSRNGTYVNLKWTTLSEDNTIGFKVQRSIGGEFKTLGFVATKSSDGNSSIPLRYEFRDLNNTNAVSWYRLVQVNKDGTEKIVPARAIRGLEDLQKMLVYPNPGTYDNMNVLFGKSSIRDISIVDLGGRIIKRWNNYSDDNLTIQGLQTGLYMLVVADKINGGKMVERILITNKSIQ